MQDIRESLEIVDQSQTPRYVSRFEPLLTQKNFHYTSTQDFPHREPPLRIWQIQIWSTQLLSPTNNLYTRGKTQQLSPLHLEGWALSQTTITSYKRHKTLSQTPPQSPLHKRVNNKPNSSTITFTQEGDPQTQSKEITTLGGLNKPQTNFFTKNKIL